MIVPAPRRTQASGDEKALQNRVFLLFPGARRQTPELTGREPPWEEFLREFIAPALPASPDDLIAGLVPAEPKRRPAPIV